MWRHALLFVVMLLLLLAAAWGVSFMAKKSRESVTLSTPSGAIPVETAVVTQGAVEKTVTFSGSLRSPSAVMVVSRTSGRIVLKNFNKGGAVNVGDILYKIEKDTVDASRRQAEAGVAAARASLAQARAAFKNADIEYKRAKVLFQEGSVTRQMLDTVETGYSTASGALSAADAGLRTAGAALDLAAIAYNDTTIKSPAAGRVVEDFNLEAGATLAPGAPVAEVVQISTLKAVVPLPECYISKVGKGTLVHIYPEGSAVVIDAEVTTLNPSVNEMNRAAELTALFKTPLDENGRELFFPGQSCSVAVVLERQVGLVIPASAVVQRDSTDTVAIVENGRAKVVPVKVGLTTSREATVMDGLKEGQIVVSAGARLLKMGEKEGDAGADVEVIK